MNNDRYITINNRVWDKLNNKYLPNANDVMNGKIDKSNFLIEVGNKSYIKK